MNKKIFFIILLGVLAIPALASAAITIEGMVQAAVKTTLYIASGIVVVFWIVAGLLFLTAQGEPAKVTSAKHALVAAVAGTVLVIVAGGAIGLVSSMFGLGG